MSIKTNDYDMENFDIAWCPGCGNFALHRILKAALMDLKIKPTDLMLVSGIGQAAKMPQYVKGHMFNGLHGRSLPAAMAINAANPNLKVIVDSGDGCTFGEGGNHFMHQITRNPDITVLAHDNQVYGLTKGQASPTSMKGMITPVQVNGVVNEPFNPLAVAISLNASFVARAYVGDIEQTKEIIKSAINHKGFSIVDIFCPCVTFNKINTYKWYKDNTYYLEKDYDPTNREHAFKRALETDKYLLGIFYKEEGRPVFHEQTSAYKTKKTPLFERTVDMKKVKKFLDSKI